MKKFFTISSFIYSLFLVLTLGMTLFAILALNEIEIGSFLRYYAIFYLIVLLIALGTIITNTVIAFKEVVKSRGFLRTLLRISIALLIGVAVAVACSLIKHKVFFSFDFFFIPIVAIVLSLISLIQKE